MKIFTVFLIFFTSALTLGGASDEPSTQRILTLSALIAATASCGFTVIYEVIKKAIIDAHKEMASEAKTVLENPAKS